MWPTFLTEAGVHTLVSSSDSAEDTIAALRHLAGRTQNQSSVTTRQVLGLLLSYLLISNGLCFQERNNQNHGGGGRRKRREHGTDVPPPLGLGVPGVLALKGLSCTAAFSEKELRETGP